MKKVIFLLIIGMALGIITMQLILLAQEVKVKNYNVLYEVSVNFERINVRTQPTTKADIVYEVVKSETYKVVETFDDGTYTWYKIIYSDRATGWIASYNLEPWVEIVD